jgi:hypothetical protein
MALEYALVPVPVRVMLMSIYCNWLWDAVAAPPNVK